MAEETTTSAAPQKKGIAISGISIGHCGISQYGKTWELGVNSAGGASVKFSFINTGDKSIKYAKFYMIPYNAVGDAVGCDTRKCSEFCINLTGPVEPGKLMKGVYAENCWYNSSIKTARVSKVEIQYMDGTEKTLTSFDSYNPSSATSSNGGCYVATAVYGSYDCPQVWTLRRYRDYDLAETRRGRAFIKTYYAISPTLVKWFGETEWFKKMWRGKLDALVRKCKKKGYADTPYNDRVW